MDGSFLSSRATVEASRPFVCIRLATYENQDEVDFMKALYVSYTGEIANTLFALLSPDGKTRLSEADRSPAQVFGGVIQRRASQQQRPGRRRRPAGCSGTSGQGQHFEDRRISSRFRLA